MELLGTDISSWRIAFVDTGKQSTIGERLAAVGPYLEGDEYFLATYGDGLTDAPLRTWSSVSDPRARRASFSR